MKIEFLPWYRVNNAMLRCDGEDGCGALVMSDDAEKHKSWHEKNFSSTDSVVPALTKRESRRTAMSDLVCTYPGCERKQPHSHGKWTGDK